MFASQEAKRLLGKEVWEEGRIFGIVEGPYRYRVMVHCSILGRQRAIFANGEYPYFCYTEILAGNGQWVERGNGIVPVLPDGRVIMVVEQRPAQSRFGDRPMVALISGRKVNLARFGKHSSLEFPGGGVDPNEGLRVGALRELSQETGIAEQTAALYVCLRPVFIFGSDIPLQHTSNVAFLSGLAYQKYVPDDGGLNVVSLSVDEVKKNIYDGVICSGQAALTSWRFYEEVAKAREDSLFMGQLIGSGYMSVETVKIAQAK